MDVTGDSDDSDDDDDDSDDTDSDDDDSDDDDSDDDDSDDDDSGDDSDDTDSSATTTDDSTDSSDTTASAATTANNMQAYCASLSFSQCANAYASDGNALCAVNAVSDQCYAVVPSQGMYGAGNYDDGYTRAQQEMESESEKLNAIVGVLAAIVVLLVLALIAGAYFLHQKTRKMTQLAEESHVVDTITANDDKDVDAPMVTGHDTVYTE